MITGSKQARRHLEENQRQTEERQIRDMGVVMHTVEGRRFVFDLIDRRCGVFGPSYTGNSETFKREGMREVGIKLMQDVQRYYTAEYVTMISEAFKFKQHDDLVEKAANKIAEGETE